LYAAVPAFPGAEGYGAATRGGRGGKVVFVENLNDAGSGSLRAALELEGPRTILFRVGGTITLKSQITITSPFVTVAGQSASGGGITLKMANSANGAAINIATHDVVIRYIRIRRGRPDTEGCCDDGLSIANAGGKSVYNVIIDHCSVSWATDELFDVWYQAENITVQWSIFSEALADLSARAVWGKGPIVGDRSAGVSIHHNLFANNIQRNPLLKTNVGSVAYFDVINNVTYNWAHAALSFDGSQTGSKSQLRANVIGNVFIEGPQYTKGRYAITFPQEKMSSGFMYVRDNIGPYRRRQEANDWAVVGLASDGKNYMKVPAPEGFKAGEKWGGAEYPISEIASHELTGVMFDKVGAVFPSRDSVDARVVQQVVNNTGKIISDPQAVGGWPEISAGQAPADSDEDGMPDEWERQQGLNSEQDDSAMDEDNDGYTNIEEYLNELVVKYYVFSGREPIKSPSRLRVRGE